MSGRNNVGKIIILILVFFLGFKLGGWLNSAEPPGIEKVKQVLELTNNYYYEKIDLDTLSENAIDGVLSKLDPHSVYIPTDIQSAIEEQMHGSFEGIGIEFQIIDDTITVVSPIIGGPSEKLGIQPGDKIIKIEDSSAVGFSNTNVINNLRGEKGSEVNLTIYRPSVQELYEYTIERDVIPINSVEVSLLVQDSVGYVSITRFAEKTFDELSDALNKLKSNGMKYLVLDLRNNPGGLLDQSVSISDLFINEEKLIVYTKGRIPEFNEEFRAGEKSPYEEIPLLILMNRGSASASEIVSGSVQDWDRGLIIGETSFGKGTVQRPFLLEDGSVVRLTISKYYTPSGRAIQRDFSDKEKYYREVAERKNDSTEIEHDSLDAAHPKYQTASGRTVYAKGGIEPDHFVATGELSKITASIRSKNLFYKFIRNQLDNGKLKVDGKFKTDLNIFKDEFQITNKIVNNFKKFVKSNDITLVETEFDKDQDYIRDLLKAYLAREYFNSIGWYTVLLNQDEPFKAALNYLKEAKSMAERD